MDGRRDGGDRSDGGRRPIGGRYLFWPKPGATPGIQVASFIEWIRTGLAERNSSADDRELREGFGAAGNPPSICDVACRFSAAQISGWCIWRGIGHRSLQRSITSE